MPFLDGLRANLSLGFDVTKAERQTFTPSSLHSQTKTGNDGSDYRSNPSQVNTVLEGYLDYAVPRTLGPGTLDLTGRLLVLQVRTASFRSTLLTGLSTDLLGGNGIPSARTTQTLRGRPGQQADLVLRAGQLQHQRPLPGGGQPPP